MWKISSKHFENSEHFWAFLRWINCKCWSVTEIDSVTDIKHKYWILFQDRQTNFCHRNKQKSCNMQLFLPFYKIYWLCSGIEQLNNFSESDIFMFSTLIFLIQWHYNFIHIFSDFPIIWLRNSDSDSPTLESESE